VRMRTRLWLTALAGLCLARAGFSASPSEPAPLPLAPVPGTASSNQTMADTIAEHLRRSSSLEHYNVEITCRDGVVELYGRVHDQRQREEVLRLVQGVSGVDRLRDHLIVDGGVRPVEDAEKIPTPTPEVEKAPIPTPTPVPDSAKKAEHDPQPEPQPLFAAPPPSPYALNPPKMPPYAWPTYAPYNNFSRVAYPLAYPYNAWPYIGPCYPFPKVPLGWRSVKLEWDDGYWWFSRTATKYDWWRLRYY
jgi:BON domain